MHLKSLSNGNIETPKKKTASKKKIQFTPNLDPCTMIENLKNIKPDAS